MFMGLKQYFFVFVFIVLNISATHAQKTNQEKTDPPTFDYTSYNQCQRQVVKDLKAQTISTAEARRKNQQCRAKFPAAALFNTCRGQAIRPGLSTTEIRSRIETCRGIAQRISFDPNKPSLLARVGQKVYFAGVDFSAASPVESIKSLPDYNCQPLETWIEGQGKADALLFGNDPLLFPAMKALARNVAAATAQNPLRIPYFGEVAPTRAKMPLLFFYTGFCSVKDVQNSLYIDHKLYYLYSQRSKATIPYFGVSFYKKNQSTIGEEPLKKLVSAELGPTFNTYRLRSNTYILSKTRPTVFDDEGDPANVCDPSFRKNNPIVAMIKTYTDKLSAPYALFVINIENACRYGELESERLFSQ